MIKAFFSLLICSFQSNAYSIIKKQKQKQYSHSEGWHCVAAIQVPVTPLLIQLSANEPQKAEENGQCPQDPAIHVGNVDGVPGSQLSCGLTLVIATI